MSFNRHFLKHDGETLKKKKIYKEISKMIKEEGLEAFLKKSNKFNIGKDIFLNATDLVNLVLLDKSQRAEKNILEKLQRMANFPETKAFLTKKPDICRHAHVKELNGEGMQYCKNMLFESWEGTVHNRPSLVFFPKSIKGIQNLVTWASSEGKRVRASGYRHSSSDIFSQENEILVSMLDFDVATKLPATHPGLDRYSDLQGIQLIGEPYMKEGRKKILCKIGSASCNYHFQDWVYSSTGGSGNWTLPLNVVVTEITFGGSNAAICHGGGINNKTISDLVTEVEFVNAKGERQIVSDKEQIKAAAGCFGLLGIVTSLTLELDEMTYANFKTVEKKLLALTIPPPSGYQINQALRDGLSRKNLMAIHDTEKQQAALTDFVNCCENEYYNEWFWFPLQDECWINCWNNDGDKNKAVRYPGNLITERERIESYLGYLASMFLGDAHPILRKIQTKLMGDIAMSLLPDHKETVCPVEDAIHFRQGIHNVKTRLMEVDIPVPNKNNSNEPDWSICQKAWWNVIETVYSKNNMHYFPMRTTLEMRVMSGSDIIMAPQYQNQRTCCIEILTPMNVNESRWTQFLQEILDKWSELKDDQGHYLNIRPHWAKRFNNLNINRSIDWSSEWSEEQKRDLQAYLNNPQIISMPIEVYLKNIAYKDQIKTFIEKINIICCQGGYTLEDILARFSNPLFDYLLKPGLNAPTQNHLPDLDDKMNEADALKRKIQKLSSYIKLEKYISDHIKSNHMLHIHANKKIQKLNSIFTQLQNEPLGSVIDNIVESLPYFKRGTVIKTRLFHIKSTPHKLLKNLLDDLLRLHKTSNHLLIRNE